MNRSSGKRVALALALAAALAPAVPAVSHHSFAVYDRTKTLTLRGTVKSFQWTNPHCVIWVVIQPEGGGDPQEWSIETTSPGVLTRSGWTRHSLKPGDRVSANVNPLRDGSHGGGLNFVTLLDTGQTLKVNFAESEKPELK